MIHMFEAKKVIRQMTCSGLFAQSKSTCGKQMVSPGSLWPLKRLTRKVISKEAVTLGEIKKECYLNTKKVWLRQTQNIH